MKMISGLCLSGTLALTLAAQTPTAGPAARPASPVRAEMKKLDPLVGRWTGESWIEYGGERRAASVTETIQWKQDGLLLVIEGIGRRKAAAGSAEEGAVVHDALGVVFYDAAARRYVFHAYRQGNFVESEWKPAEKGYEWGFKDPRSNAAIRFTIDVSDENRWVETGEISQDGSSRHKFFEMTLTRAR